MKKIKKTERKMLPPHGTLGSLKGDPYALHKWFKANYFKDNRSTRRAFRFIVRTHWLWDLHIQYMVEKTIVPRMTELNLSETRYVLPQATRMMGKSTVRDLDLLTNQPPTR